jgi:hypothetical protein
MCHAADADDLAGHVHRLEPVEQQPSVVRERSAVGEELFTNEGLHLVRDRLWLVARSRSATGCTVKPAPELMFSASILRHAVDVAASRSALRATVWYYESRRRALTVNAMSIGLWPTHMNVRVIRLPGTIAYEVTLRLVARWKGESWARRAYAHCHHRWPEYRDGRNCCWRARACAFTKHACGGHRGRLRRGLDGDHYVANSPWFPGTLAPRLSALLDAEDGGFAAPFSKGFRSGRVDDPGLEEEGNPAGHLRRELAHDPPAFGLG